MAQSSPPRLISCDEAGYTGPKLLDDMQPYFAYAAIDLTPQEASDIVKSTRAKYHIQSPELKASLLRKRDNWPVIALDILGPLNGRAMVVAADKRLNLAGKTFEYIFEPVLEKQSSLFYHYDLHRFLMNALHRAFFKAGGPVPKLAKELQAFMKSFDPADAPTVFSADWQDGESDEILDCVLRFARGYANVIAKQSEPLQKEVNPVGKWTLDLTTTCLFSLILHGWGHHYQSLDILCDDSKPLLAMSHIFAGFVGSLFSAHGLRSGYLTEAANQGRSGRKKGSDELRVDRLSALMQYG